MAGFCLRVCATFLTSLCTISSVQIPTSKFFVKFRFSVDPPLTRLGPVLNSLLFDLDVWFPSVLFTKLQCRWIERQNCEGVLRVIALYMYVRWISFFSCVSAYFSESCVTTGETVQTDSHGRVETSTKLWYEHNSDCVLTILVSFSFFFNFLRCHAPFQHVSIPTGNCRCRCKSFVLVVGTSTWKLGGPTSRFSKPISKISHNQFLLKTAERKKYQGWASGPFCQCGVLTLLWPNEHNETTCWPFDVAKQFLWISLSTRSAKAEELFFCSTVLNWRFRWMELVWITWTFMMDLGAFAKFLLAIIAQFSIFSAI